jgi:hypothetical protein
MIFAKMNQSARKLSLAAVLTVALLVMSGCAPSAPEEIVVESTIPVLPPAETETMEPAPEPTLQSTDNPSGQWTAYSNQAYQFQFSFPADWFGPDVYEWEDGLRLAVGSDLVYPYGTSREDQINTVPDSYFITIQYDLNKQNKTWDDFVNSGWITSYLELQDLEVGASTSTVRSLVIKVGEVTLGNFKGLEYIFTLPDTAQTERVYGREILAFDDNLNMLRITAAPNLVTISDESSWKTDYQRVDESYQEIFRYVAESITIQ